MLTEEQKKALIEKHKDAEWLAVDRWCSFVYLQKDGCYYSGNLDGAVTQTTAPIATTWYRDCKALSTTITFLIDKPAEREAKKRIEEVTKERWIQTSYTLPPGYTQDAACLEAQARLLKRFPDGAVVARAEKYTFDRYVVAVRKSDGSFLDEGSPRLENFHNLEEIESREFRSMTHVGFAEKVFGQQKQDEWVKVQGDHFKRNPVTVLDPKIVGLEAAPTAAPEPACKWHQKLVGEKFDFALRALPSHPSEYAAVKAKYAEFVAEGEASRLKMIKHSLREWPTCSEGQVDVRWWERGYIRPGLMYYAARWECSCGRAGGVNCED